jgi:hypothetical protein
MNLTAGSFQLGPGTAIITDAASHFSARMLSRAPCASTGFDLQIMAGRKAPKNAIVLTTSAAPGGAGQRIGRQADPVPRQYHSTSPVRDRATIDFLGAQVANQFHPLLPGTGLSGLNVSRSRLLRPHPQFSSIAFNNNQGYSWYHALQTRFEKRFAAGYTVNVALTWSKLMEATGYLNVTDRVPERVISGQDRTHRVVVTALWEFPFGRGRRFGSSARGILGQLIGGWQAQGIHQKRSGPALGFGNLIFNGDLRIIPLAKDQRTVDRWFDINWDLSVIKRIRVTERVQFRTGFLNPWNHTTFPAPHASPSSSGFGTVTSESQYPRTNQFAAKLTF